MSMCTATISAATPRYLQLNDKDNVAVIANDGGLPAGSRFADGLTLAESIPQAHKAALVDIAKDAPIIRYGVPIGYALEAIPKGAWVSEARMRMPEPPDLETLRARLAQFTPYRKPAEPLTGYTFEGYRNADGSVGTRNILAISTTVQCAAPIARIVAERIRAELLPRYPNVDGVVAIEHVYGCGVAIDAPGAEIPIRSLQNIAKNPNFGGLPLLVSLGCEKLSPERFFPEGSLPASPLTVRAFRMLSLCRTRASTASKACCGRS